MQEVFALMDRLPLSYIAALFIALALIGWIMDCLIQAEREIEEGAPAPRVRS